LVTLRLVLTPVEWQIFNKVSCGLARSYWL
jgi:hypothetical protein